MPALEAAKCAELQGNEACERFHIALMKAHFEQNRDISEREVLVAVAGEVRLDVAKFISDLDSGSQISKVIAEYEEAQEEYPGFGIPTAVFGGRHPIVGAVPLDVYRRIVERQLKRQASAQ